jgi:hypothetical protein
MARIKGSAMLNAVKALRANKDAARKLLPTRLYRYLDERIMASSWYPEDEQLELIRALAQILPDVVPEASKGVYEFMGRFTAQADLGGLYSHMIRPGNAVGSLRRGITLWRTYHDTGTMKTHFPGPGMARLELRGYEGASSEMCRLLTGWYGEMVRMTGARDVEIVESLCVDRGDALCQWEIKWKEPLTRP